MHLRCRRRIEYQAPNVDGSNFDGPNIDGFLPKPAPDPPIDRPDSPPADRPDTSPTASPDPTQKLPPRAAWPPSMVTTIPLR